MSGHPIRKEVVIKFIHISSRELASTQRWHWHHMHWPTGVGIGLSEFKKWNKAQGKERRDMALGEVRQEEEQAIRSKALGLGKQKTWTRWNLPER